MSFVYETTVKLHDTDAAGLIFFGHQFRMAHDVYQAYLESCGISFGEVLERGEILIPIVHAAADYLKPLMVGDRLKIELSATKISTHSFTLKYQLLSQGEMVGSVETVHVTIDRENKQKCPLPETLRTALQKIHV